MRTFLLLLFLPVALHAAPDINVKVYELPGLAAQLYAEAWLRQDPVDHGVAVSEGTSMEPLLHAGDWNLMERYKGQTLRKGDYVYINEGRGREAVGHFIYDLRPGFVFVSNLNARHSDGWYPVSAVKWLIPSVVRSTAPYKAPLPRG